MFNDNLITISLLYLLNYEPCYSNLKNKIKVFESHFYDKLINYSPEKLSKDETYYTKTIFYSSVSKWTKNKSLFDYDFVVYPINIINKHWNMCILVHPDKIKMLVENEYISCDENKFCVLLVDSAVQWSNSRPNDAYHPNFIIEHILEYVFQVSFKF